VGKPTAKSNKRAAAASNGVALLHKITWCDTDNLHIAPWNWKPLHVDEDVAARFQESLKKGVTPLHVAECEEEPDTLEICDGNHRYAALRALGLKKLPVYHHGKLTRAERMDLAVRLNGTWFISETISLAQCLREITEAMPDAEDALPQDANELTRLLATLNMDLPEQEFPAEKKQAAPKARGGRVSNVKTIVCPHCGKEFSV